MIITRKATFFLGVFIFIIPFLGFPSLWKMALTIISGVTLVVLSVRVNLPKKSFPRLKREKPVGVAENILTEVPLPPPPPLPPYVPTPKVVHKVSEVKKRRVTKKNNGPVS